MFEKVVTWFRPKARVQSEPDDAELKELAKLLEHGAADDPETIKRMAKLLGEP
jgi:hypothetical protein